MITYRLYILGDERVIRTETFDAPDDVAAIDAAHARGAASDSELWCDDRLVAFIPGRAEPGRP